jgi:hypothetical protein
MNTNEINILLALFLLSLTCCICYRAVLMLIHDILSWFMDKLHWAVKKQDELREDLKNLKEKP